MKRALIVDDIAQNLYLLRALLQGNGWQVDEARQGAEALVQARQAPPDLVISDLLMPVMDGYTLLRHWKADAALQHIPFVVYTATYTDPKDESLARALGADAFIIKPAEPDPFMAHIDAVLQRVQGRTAVAVSALPLDEQQLLADYNATLVRKLEKRALQLEQSNHELQASEERFRATFEQAAVGIAHVGLDGRCLRVNDKLCEITGHGRSSLLGLALADLAVPEDRAQAAAAHAAMLAGTQASHTSELRLQHHNGHIVWGNRVSTLLRGPDGQPQYFIEVLADITERKLLEEQLRQAQKIESIGQLTGGIAHDFNNLLTVIIGNAELLTARLAGDEPLRALAEMTRVAAHRGADLTRRLLAFARRQTLAPRAVDVHALLQGMEGMLRRMLPAHIDIRLAPAGGLWPALVDPSQLESAMLNLAINARDAMPGGGRLDISTANATVEAAARSPSDPEAGDYVVITVSDTGAGIRPEHLAHVFEPFFTTKPPGIGTGLGLSMVHGFVKQSRGHITLQSSPGQGTQLQIHLPRSSRVDEVPPATTPAPAASLHGSEHILLAEDDALVRQHAEQQLLALGYRITAVADGAAALAVLQTPTTIDLLFTDLVMPGSLNGRQLADAALALRPGLPVLFTSGDTEDAMLHLGGRDRRVQLLRKPYGSAELASMVRAALAASTAPAAPARPAQLPPGRVPAGTLLVLDDDPMVAMILGHAAETVGFHALLTTTPQAFFDGLSRQAPSHVAIDLAMPEMGGLQILDRLAQVGCAARVIISSGADASQLDAALAHGRALGLNLAGALAKPFSLTVLADLLARPAAA